MVDITDNAFKRVYKLAQIEESNNFALRVSVDGGGCSGFLYKYEMVSEVDADDKLFIKHGATIVIDPLSLDYMKDSIIDFVEELGSSYFSIKNPNATLKCGCGNSFAI